MTTWIFQGNPKLFDVDRYLSERQEVLWGANQGHTMMAPGDTVYFWRSLGRGEAHPGIVARGTITEGPREREPDPAAAPLWHDKGHGDGQLRQVSVRVELGAGERLVPAVYLQRHELLKQLEVLRVPNATNFLRLGAPRPAKPWARTCK